MRITAILFDLDNTLADRVSAVRRMASALYDAEPAIQAVATREEAIATYVEFDRDGSVADKAAFFRELIDVWGPLTRTPEQLAGWYSEVYPVLYEPDPRTDALLDRLEAERLPWGIVTNGAPTQRVKLRVLGLAHRTPCVAISSELGVAKPDPAIFEHARRCVGAPDPSRVLFVGDNPDADIDGACRFGMRTAWIRRGREWPSELQPPDLVLDHVADLDLAAVIRDDS